MRLLKSSATSLDSALNDPESLTSHPVKTGLGFSGRLYVANPKQGPPDWRTFLETGIDDELKGVTNRSNAAVLVVRRRRRIFVFTFGYAWHLLREDVLEPDFGLKAALNGIHHDSLQSLDSFAIEEQTVHRRSQASRASGLGVFGIDVSRDILRAITGRPRDDVPLKGLTGSGSALVVAAQTDFGGLGPLTDLLLSLYRKRRYRDHFSFVDFVQRVADPGHVQELDEKLIDDLQKTAPLSYLAPPEPVDWTKVQSFGYGGVRKHRDLEASIGTYLEHADRTALTVELLHHHRLTAYGNDGATPHDGWSIYNCLVFEVSQGDSRFVLTGGQWFEIDQTFAAKVLRTVRRIPISELVLPTVGRRPNGRLEAEPEYNARVAREHTTMALLHGKTPRVAGTRSGIEVCDLLTDNRSLVHVKHRKGGSSSLSHMFAQGRNSAEALWRDEEYRVGARRVLRRIRPAFEARIPASNFQPDDFRVVFAILGGDAEHPGEDLPFFSQLTLARTYEALAPLQFHVEVVGVAPNG